MTGGIGKCITLDKVEKSFGKQNVIDGVSFSVENGHCFGLLGPSGAGKTTIIKILTGQLDIEGGTAMLWGEKCNALSDDTYNKVGMVLDDSGVFERLSCIDNLKVFCQIYGIGYEAIEEVLTKVGLQDAIKKPLAKFSKGMRQRFVFARAIMHKPKLLFLDEPTSGLDPTTTLEIHKLIKEMQADGATIFLTTHNMVEATNLCDIVALLNEGNIIEEGEPHEICRKYNTKQMIDILLKNGQSLELPNKAEAADEIAQLIRTEQIKSMHSSEPTLEKVFIELTGRGLE